MMSLRIQAEEGDGLEKPMEITGRTINILAYP
jgi:hypothetical protein